MKKKTELKTECANCFQFLTTWSGHIVPLNFFCEKLKGHNGLHKTTNKNHQGRKFAIEWM